MSKKCDLHIHSTASDGKLTPYEIVCMAKKKGIDVISITDHNSIDGIEEGIKASKKIKIEFIPGVELSTRFKGERIHILGYFKKKEYNDLKLKEALKYVKYKKIYKLNKLFLGQFKIKKNRKRLTVEEGIKLLRMFNATIVLAHPFKIKKELLDSILNYDFDGIEAIRGEHTKAEEKFYKNIAKKKGLIYTAGSDFHSIDKSDKHSMIGNVYLKVDNIKKILKLS